MYTVLGSTHFNRPERYIHSLQENEQQANEMRMRDIPKMKHENDLRHKYLQRIGQCSKNLEPSAEAAI